MYYRLIKYLPLILLSLIFCKSIDNKIFDNRKIFSGTVNKNIESNDRIDKWRTYEIFYILKGNEDCIQINLTAENIDEISDKIEGLKIYYIIDKPIDISKFNVNNKMIYSEIGRNFDGSWDLKQEINICSSLSDPIKKLNKDNKYRIRFTSFTDNYFTYKLMISAKHAVEISEK